MSTNPRPDPIRIGLVADEPIRLAGLASIFDQPAQQGQPRLLPVVGSMTELLASADLEYLVFDLHGSSSGLEVLGHIRRTRPDIRLIVIGPEVVRKAVEIVTCDSIWAPRRLLSKLIDRLLNVRDSSLTNAGMQLTAREKQVLELILTARSNREIAAQLGIEERTVKAYVGRLMRKTGADNRIKLSISALNHFILSQDSSNGSREPGEPPKRVTKK